MRITDEVARHILEIIESSQLGYAEIQRNELAQTLGCVPSQINYVITSRFTPEQGYVVESRRGSGGYIKITRLKMDAKPMLMHVINAVSEELDYMSAQAIVINLQSEGYISAVSAKLMLAAMSERSLLSAPKEQREKIRSSIFKNMILAQI